MTFSDSQLISSMTKYIPYSVKIQHIWIYFMNAMEFQTVVLKISTKFNNQCLNVNAAVNQIFLYFSSKTEYMK